jgi:hypothetical protein
MAVLRTRDAGNRLLARVLHTLSLLAANYLSVTRTPLRDPARVAERTNERTRPQDTL